MNLPVAYWKKKITLFSYVQFILWKFGAGFQLDKTFQGFHQDLRCKFVLATMAMSHL